MSYKGKKALPRLKDAGEQDALTKARGLYTFGPGVLKWWKRRFNKRVRREAKKQTQNED